MESKKKKGALWAPFKVFWLEKMYIVWPVFVLFFGLVNIWGSFFRRSNEEVVDAFSSGVLFTFSISVCTTLFADLIIDLLVNKKSKRPLSFLTYRIASIAISTVWIFVLAFAWTGTLRGSVICQLIVGIISMIISCYMYGISKMDSHKKCFETFDDQEYEYLDDENATVHNNISAQKDLTQTPGGIAL